MKEMSIVHTDMKCGVCGKTKKQKYITTFGGVMYPTVNKFGVSIGRSKICRDCLGLVVENFYDIDELEYISHRAREKWQEQFPKEELTEAQKLRRAFSKNKKLKKSVLERDAYRCLKCEDHRELHVDHILPLSKGGDNDISNLQTLCRSCNSSKGTRTVSYLKEVQYG